MAEQVPKNIAKSKLVVPVTSAGQTTLTLTAGTGTKFGATGTYRVLLWNNPDTGPFEICTVTSRATDVLTVTRASESVYGVQTAFSSWALGTNVGEVVTAAALTALLAGGSSGIEVKEVDGAPDVVGVTKIVVSNSTLIDNGGGQVTLTTGGGGGGSNTVTVYNPSGSTILKGSAVYETGLHSGVLQVAVLQNTRGNALLGVTTADILTHTNGTVQTSGTLTGMNTSIGAGFHVGDAVWINSGGSIVSGYDSNPYSHFIGWVTVSDATVGEILMTVLGQDVSLIPPHGHTAGDDGDLLSIPESSVANLTTDLAAKAPVASPTFTGVTTAPEFSASGLTGAVSASRYVGATASGAPVSGTFVLGDWIAAQDGKRWTCTVGGTPGTWVQEPGTGGGSGLYSAYLCYTDEKAAGTDGGTFTSGDWRTRDLNTERTDSGGHGSVASNQVTLDTGTYDVWISCPAFSVDIHHARLYDITHTAQLLVGTAEYSANGFHSSTRSVIVGTIVLSGSTVLEVQHRCQTTGATNGFGASNSQGVAEVFTVAEFRKRA